MLERVPVRHLLGTLAACGLLAGCASPSGSATPPLGQSVAVSQARHHRSWLRHVAGNTPLVYVGDQQNDEVIVFNKTSGAVIGEITESSGVVWPQGLFVDAKHNLWVVNGPGANSDVEVFPRGSTTASRTLSDTEGDPAMDVTVCHNGTAYVTNNTNFSIGTGSIEIYPSGSTEPTGSLVFPNIAYEYFVTCDRKGNIFTDITNQYFTNDVVEFKKGQQSGATDLNISLSNPGAIKPEDAGNLLIADQGTNSIAEYTESGSPTGTSISLTGNVYDFAPSRKGAFVGGSDQRKGAAFVWSWPGGVEQSMDYADPNKSSSPYGFAFDPGQKGLGK